MSDVLPLLAVIRSPVRGLAATLPQVETAPATSPWSPQPAPAPAPATGAVDPAAVAAAREAARREGLEEGLRETEALRARLVELIDALEHARELAAPATSARIADAAACVVDAWLGGGDRRALFEPIIHGWIAGAGGAPATAHVHPDDVAAMTAAIGDAPIQVTADVALGRGEVRIRGGALELAHALDDRLPELRTAILAALEAT